MPPWLEVAYDELTVKELPGPEHTPRILEYHAVTTLKATEDETPWCSAFVCFCLEKVGITSTKSAQARSYLTWGIPLSEPKKGCIVVLRRTTDPVKGHVGFYVGGDPINIAILGGNQSNEVRITFYPRNRIMGYRWPNQDPTSNFPAFPDGSI